MRSSKGIRDQADMMERGTMIVKGRSMGLTILEGDRIRIEGVDPRSIRIGDAVVYIRDGRLTLHRVLLRRAGKEGVEYLTKGDGSFLPDGWIDHRRVIGRVEGFERDGSFFTLRGGRGRVYTIGLFLLSHLLIPVTLLIDLWRLVSPWGDPPLLRTLRGFKKGSSLLFARWLLSPTRR